MPPRFGVNLTLTARVESVLWDMGDGTKIQCGRGTEWKPGMFRDGPRPSPSKCGHTYVRQGTYRVRATSRWVAHWTGYGQSGDIRLQLSRSFTHEVGEIKVIVTSSGR